MSDEEKTAGDGGTAAAAASVPSPPPPIDEHTTVPNAPEPDRRVAPQGAGKWQMPKPKFQQTSGYLPQGYLKDIKHSPATTAGSEDTTQEQAPFIPAAAGDGTAANASPAPTPAVEPQPDLAEIILEEPAGEPMSAPAQAKRGSGIPLIVLVLAGIAAFVVIFLAAVYFLFLNQSIGGTNS